ncbi:signal peptidase I [Aureibaculum sp. 2210JD6-5]|uniref:signal peptidase I n=1 Tax=Aureibaculum sp. 2210JD6-5 TaxID=3103957 RepID=UPI002AACB04D|nr:signal peptidase I [Aureibaculum sp. 2210JD6-5]MDY7395548.1 signal peptidase I [Aureibaculum sp. 2210JD6-5]
MTFTEWFIFFLVIQVIHFLGTWKLYVKAGRQAWEAAIPVYNAIILMKIINRPWWWVILLFIPIVNLLMFPVVWVETIRSFGKNSRLDTILVIITLGLYIFYVNYATDVEYIEDRSLKPRTTAGEWISSIVFAIIAATLVHTYVMQPYTIPSSSLEKTLLIGDFLFVSKFHYGARVPMTTVALPMVHDTIPFTNSKSYLFNDNIEKKETSWKNKLQLPYMRLPGFQKIKRNDIVVFNQPADTLLDMNKFNPDRNYYKPIDKKTNLVKRCVAIAGDSLEIRDGYIYINGERTTYNDRAKIQYNFNVNTGGQAISQTALANRYNVREGGRMQNGNYFLTLTDEEAALIAKNPAVKSVTKSMQPKGRDGGVFPHVPSLGWNTDNFGPIYIPKKGETVKLTKESLPFYKRLIREYEGNNLIINGDEILINGKDADSYTFKQDYYWMMGDNRQNSLDARAWGFVPFDHVVGKPVLIWMSWEGWSPRWERFFTTVGGNGKPVSYFKWFIGLVVLWFVFDFFRKRRKK